MPLARAAARAMMPRLVNYGWSSSKITKWLAGHNATYRRVTMLTDIRQFRNMAEFGPRVVKYTGSKIIPKSLMSEVDLSRARRYRVYGMAKYTDVETGAVRYKNVSFYADDRRSKDEWSQEFEDMIRAEDYKPDQVISDIKILHVEHNRGLEY
ncbi:hypothetical protein LCGC14_0771580 [marine sediment metagenome]|uniref:Uncharacterized protein n=1 Tax=marine sediment metagenome TaxID=412755 RepID=A0A0F9PYA1_9ZZZZ